ncbi:hypothetical protein ZWY2020_040941 [Hordeum vulgare]|nr:hypothetical protein ZWY2020_040941 [Hordeum vulgare]
MTRTQIRQIREICAQEARIERAAHQIHADQITPATKRREGSKDQEGKRGGEDSLKPSSTRRAGMEASRFGFQTAPAFKFDPTDADLVTHYLLPRAVDLRDPPFAHAITDDDPASLPPADLFANTSTASIWSAGWS